MEELEKSSIRCKVNPNVCGEFGCQLCWVAKKGDNTSNTREICRTVNTTSTPPSILKNDK